MRKRYKLILLLLPLLAVVIASAFMAQTINRHEELVDAYMSKVDAARFDVDVAHKKLAAYQSVALVQHPPDYQMQLGKLQAEVDAATEAKRQAYRAGYPQSPRLYPFIIVCFLPHLPLLYFAWRSKRQERHHHQRYEQELCVQCGYDVRYSEGVCPECGGDPREYLTPAGRRIPSLPRR